MTGDIRHGILQATSISSRSRILRRSSSGKFGRCWINDRDVVEGAAGLRIPSSDWSGVRVAAKHGSVVVMKALMKSESTPKTIDAYIAGFPKGVQEILRKIRRTIREAAPGAEETVKYGIPTFVLGRNLVHFAAFAKHIGFYPTPSAIEGFKDDLSAYKSAKGSVQFPLDAPIPYSLIKRIVKFRGKECRGAR